MSNNVIYISKLYNQSALEKKIYMYVKFLMYTIIYIFFNKNTKYYIFINSESSSNNIVKFYTSFIH